MTKLKPLIGEQRAQKLWLAYQMEPSVRREIELIVTTLAAKYLNETYQSTQILLEPPAQDLSSGEYELGTVMYGEKTCYPFGLREDEFIQHTAIFGRSGSGKTNVAFLLLKNFLKYSKPFWLLDWKRNGRDLLGGPFKDSDILVFTVGRNVVPFSFNPLLPPEGMERQIWLKKIIDILCHAYFLGEGVAYLLLQALDSVYRRYDTPTFQDVQTYLQTYKPRGREALWHDSSRRTIGTLCYGDFGRVLNTRTPYPLADLLTQNVILELDALNASDKTFFTEAILLWLHAYRLQEPHRETFKHALIIEEAHNILLRKKQELTGKETITDVILREIRELGEAVILLDQHPSLISKPALGNTYATIVLNLKDEHDVRAASEAMLLEPEKREYLGKLPVGHAIVKLQGRFMKPFLVKFPHFPIHKASVIDEALKEKMRGYLEPLGVSSSDDTSKPDIWQDAGVEKETHPITENEEKLLKDILNHPFSGIVERYRHLSLNVYQGNKFRDTLIQKQLIFSENIPTLKGRIRGLKLTEKGKTLLGITSEERHGGTQHEYYKEKVAELFRKKGYQVTTEYPIGGGKTVDVVAIKNQEKIAIEIETGNSDAIYNIQKCLPHVDKVISVVLDTTLKKKLQNHFQSEMNVLILTFHEFRENINTGNLVTE